MCQFSYAESSFIYTAPVHNNSSLHLILYLTLNHAYCNKIPIITQIILEMFLPQIRKNHKDWNQCKNSPAVNIYNIIYKIIINGPPKFSVQSFKMIQIYISVLSAGCATEALPSLSEAQRRQQLCSAGQRFPESVSKKGFVFQRPQGRKSRPLLATSASGSVDKHNFRQTFQNKM